MDHRIWFRKVYGELIRQRRLTACVRPVLPDGDDDWMNEPLPLRIIREPGKPSQNIPPDFEPDDGTTVIITRKVVKRMADVTTTDLVGCSPDCTTPELVRWHIGLHYNVSPLGDDVLVKIWQLLYVDSKE